MRRKFWSKKSEKNPKIQKFRKSKKNPKKSSSNFTCFTGVWIRTLLRSISTSQSQKEKSIIFPALRKHDTQQNAWVETLASRMAQNAHSKKTWSLRLAMGTPLFQLRYRFNPGTLLCTKKWRWDGTAFGTFPWWAACDTKHWLVGKIACTAYQTLFPLTSLLLSASKFLSILNDAFRFQKHSFHQSKFFIQYGKHLPKQIPIRP